MLFVHQVHRVVGAEEERFEAIFRDEWAPALAADGDARLLWFLRQAHGTGPSYAVVTITAVAGGEAWERLADRMATDGDLHELASVIDSLRYESSSKILRPLPWSPLQEVDLDAVPGQVDDHEAALFMEDTAWPFRGAYDDYLEKAGTLYVETLRKAQEAGRSLLRLEGAFTPAFGAGVHREIVLWQRIIRPEGIVGLLSHEVPAEFRAPGTWMHDALEVRDRWESRVLRTTAWSPLP